jgi:predicted ATP-grasp superfamily ATP-dependent carboligase
MPLLPTKEDPVRWISDARGRLAEFYEISLPEKQVVDALLDKATFARLAEQHGWPVPRTWRIQSREQLDDAIDRIPFPCILKPEMHTKTFGERSPRKAFKLLDADELIRHYEMASQWTQGFVVQEWIEGGDDRIAFCLTYVGRDGQPQAVFAGRKLRQFPPECGNTALCEPAPDSWKDDVCELTERIWRSLGFLGLGSVEYKMRLGSNEPVIMEPTVGRTNYQNELAVVNGVNIPFAAYCDLAGLPRPAFPTRATPYKLVDGVRELRSALYYYRTGTLTPGRWLRERAGRSRFMTFRATDPGPLVYTVAAGLRLMVGTLIERIFGRAIKLRVKTLLRGARGSRVAG